MANVESDIPITTMVDDWQIGKTLSDRLQHILNHQLMCDVTFRVGFTKTPIKSHKFMLARASPVFYSMFEGPMAEKEAVFIPDIEADVFNDILTYIYTDNIEVITVNVNGLMYASEKYMLDVIKNECEKFLTENINEDYACVVLQIAHTFYLEDLQEDALQFIFDYGLSCLESISFLSLSAGCVELIIESDKLLCAEEIVYEKMIQWAEQQCREEQHVTANKRQQQVTGNDEQLRKALGYLIYLIIFPIMERIYFTNEVSTNNVLTLEEKVEIFQSFDGKPIYTFPADMRQSSSKLEVWRCESNLNTSNLWNHNGADNCLDFTTNFDCSISGINVFGSNKYSGHHDINIDILNGSTHLGSTSTKLNSVPGQQSYPIDLAEPLPILKNITYTIKLNLKGKTCFSGKDYERVVKIGDGSTVTFTDSKLSANGTSSNLGQIPGIILSRPYYR